jgi:hypothetical protein
MTPAAIYTGVRDLLIIVAIGFVLWKVYHAGVDANQVKDLQTTLSQVQVQGEQRQQWQQKQDDAETQHAKDLAAINARLDEQHTPVVVHLVAQPGTSQVLPSPASPPTGAAPGRGGADAGSGIDLRPWINAFEAKYEQEFADCRRLRDSWPQP